MIEAFIQSLPSWFYFGLAGTLLSSCVALLYYEVKRNLTFISPITAGWTLILTIFFVTVLLMEGIAIGR